VAELIPSINVKTFEEIKERIHLVEPYVRWCHLDVTDGIFSKHITWRNPEDLLNLKTQLNLEVHLMVSEPEKVIDRWLIPPIKRVIVHLEAVTDMNSIIQKCHKKGVEVGLAINPETSWDGLNLWFGKVDLFQTLAVKPGPSGQKFSEQTYDKIIHIRQSCPECIIEVDGGVNPETAKRALDSGANLLVSGNYIFSSPDIKEAIINLTRL
jgi:ribulose-phosphate 3-epimerase